MAVQLAEREKRVAGMLADKIICPITKTVSGSEWARIVTTVIGVYDAAAPGFRENVYTLSSNANAGFSICTISSVTNYDSSFVSEMLAADAAEPEATFDNVVDMLDWLNRE
jgi:hypothetical protein